MPPGRPVKASGAVSPGASRRIYITPSQKNKAARGYSVRLGIRRRAGRRGFQGSKYFK